MKPLEIQNPFLEGVSEINKSNLKMLELPMNEFMEVIQNYLADATPANDGQWNPDEYPLMPGQALYVMNYPNNIVSYQRGIDELLGYSEEEFTMELLLSYFHPDQYETLQRITKAAVNFGISQDPKQKQNTWMLITYKARKKDGVYVPLLRQTSIYEKDIKGRMVSSFSILSDLSGMTNAEKVEWKLRGPKIDEDHFSKYIYEAYSNFFTDREMEVLKYLENGTSSQEIAKALFISKNTVDTHRRNMLGKAGSTNTIELISFARKNGVL